MTPSDLTAIHKLLSKHAVPDDLIVVRSSSRARPLIFKSSVKKGIEIVVPHGAASSWVVEMTQNRIPWIKTAQQHVREGRGQLNPTQINLKALGETWPVEYGRVDEVPKGLMVNGEHPRPRFLSGYPRCVTCHSYRVSFKLHVQDKEQAMDDLQTADRLKADL